MNSKDMAEHRTAILGLSAAGINLLPTEIKWDLGHRDTPTPARSDTMQTFRCSLCYPQMGGNGH